MDQNANEALKDFAAGGASQYIKFDEYENVVEGIYIGYSIEDDNFNPGQQKVVYELEMANERKIISSGSKRLARAVLKSEPKEGQFIRITRTGEGFDTNYEVTTSDIPF